MENDVIDEGSLIRAARQRLSDEDSTEEPLVNEKGIDTEPDFSIIKAGKERALNQLGLSTPSQRRQQQIEAEFKAKLPKTWFGEFTHGMSRSVDQLQLAGFAGGAIFADTVGLDRAANWFKEGIEEQDRQIAEAPTSVPSYKNIDSFDNFMRYVFSTGGELAPQIATSIGAGGVGTALGKMGLKKFVEREAAVEAIKAAGNKQVKNELLGFARGKLVKDELQDVTKEALQEQVGRLAGKYGALGTMAASSIGQETGSIYSDLLKDPNISEGDRKAAALTGGIIAGLADFAVEGYVASKFFKKKPETVTRAETDASSDYLKRFVKEYGKEFVKAAPGESGTELFQGIVEEAAKNWADPNKRYDIFNFTPEQKESFIDSALKGGLGGTILAGPAAIAEMPPHPDADIRKKEAKVTKRANDLSPGALNVDPTSSDARLSEIGKRLIVLEERKNAIVAAATPGTDLSNNVELKNITSEVTLLNQEQDELHGIEDEEALVNESNEALSAVEKLKAQATPETKAAISPPGVPPVTEAPAVTAVTAAAPAVTTAAPAVTSAAPAVTPAVTEAAPAAPAVVATTAAVSPTTIAAGMPTTTPAVTTVSTTAAPAEAAPEAKVEPTPEKKEFNETLVGNDTKLLEATKDIKVGEQPLHEWGNEQLEKNPSRTAFAIELQRLNPAIDVALGKGLAGALTRQQEAQEVAEPAPKVTTPKPKTQLEEATEGLATAFPGQPLSRKVGERTEQIDHVAVEQKRQEISKLEGGDVINQNLDDQTVNMLAKEGVIVRRPTKEEVKKRLGGDDVFAVADVGEDIVLFTPSEKKMAETVKEGGTQGTLWHEIGHVADLINIRREAKAKNEKFAYYEADVMNQRGKALRKAFPFLPKLGGQVYRKFNKNSQIEEMTDRELGQEMTRMVIELARTGRIDEVTKAIAMAESEAQYIGNKKGQITNFLREWIKAIKGIRDTLVQLFNPATAPKEITQAIEGMNKVLDEYGVLVNESQQPQARKPVTPAAKVLVSKPPVAPLKPAMVKTKEKTSEERRKEERAKEQAAAKAAQVKKAKAAVRKAKQASVLAIQKALDVSFSKATELFGILKEQGVVTQTKKGEYVLVNESDVASETAAAMMARNLDLVDPKPQEHVVEVADEVLTEPEKQVVAKAVGEPKWGPQAREKFAKHFADWVAGGVKLTGNALKAFKKVLNAIKTQVLAAIMIVTPLYNSSSIMTSNQQITEDVLSFETPPIGFTTKIYTGVEYTPEIASKNFKLPSQIIAIPPPTNVGNVVSAEHTAQFDGEEASEGVVDLANWVVYNSDNKGSAFMVIDKADGHGYMFNSSGGILGKFPTLIGKDVGDVMTGDSLKGGKKITPAGRFETYVEEGTTEKETGFKYGKTVDLYTSEEEYVVSIHRLYTGDPKEKRQQRLNSETPHDNRISYGCINVAEEVMQEVILPDSQESGVIVYVLPESGVASDINEYLVNEKGAAKSSANLAPNGRPSNLTDRQWHQVRTPQFKRWFGDWENDPKNASKVIDENGEPKVVMNGTEVSSSKQLTDIFDVNLGNTLGGGGGIGIYFTDSREIATEYAGLRNRYDPKYTNKFTEAYLNFRNPLVFDKEFYTGNEMVEILKKNGINPEPFIERWKWWRTDGLAAETQVWKWMSPAHMSRGATLADQFRAELNAAGFDSIIHPDSSMPLWGADKPATSYVAFEPNDIKSATRNTGAFDPNEKSAAKSSPIQSDEDKRALAEMVGFNFDGTMMEKLDLYTDRMEGSPAQGGTAAIKIPYTEEDLMNKFTEFRAKFTTPPDKGAAKSMPTGAEVRSADANPIRQALKKGLMSANKAMNRSFMGVQIKEPEIKPRPDTTVYGDDTTHDLLYQTQPNTESNMKAQALVNENGDALNVAQTLETDPLGKTFGLNDISGEGPLGFLYDNVIIQLGHTAKYLVDKEQAVGSVALNEVLRLRQLLIETIAALRTGGGQIGQSAGKINVIINGQSAKREFLKSVEPHAEKIMGKTAKEKFNSLKEELNSLIRQFAGNVVNAPKVIAGIRRLYKHVSVSKFAKGVRQTVIKDLQKLESLMSKMAARAAEFMAGQNDSEAMVNKATNYFVTTLKNGVRKLDDSDELDMIYSVLRTIGTEEAKRELGVTELPSAPKADMRDKMVAVLSNEDLYQEFAVKLREKYISEFGGGNPSPEFMRQADDMYNRIAAKMWRPNMVAKLVNETMRKLQIDVAKIVKERYEIGQFAVDVIREDIKKYMEDNGVYNDELVDLLVQDVEEQMQRVVDNAREKFYGSKGTIREFLKSLQTNLAELAKSHPSYVEHMEPQFEALLVGYGFPNTPDAPVAQTLAKAMQEELNDMVQAERVKIIEKWKQTALAKGANIKAREQMDKVVEKILQMSNMGVIRDEDLYRALAEHFKLPPFSKELADEIYYLGELIGNSGNNRTKEMLKQKLADKITEAKGVSTSDMYISWMYFSMLSGVGTWGVNIAGNLTNMIGYITVAGVRELGRGNVKAFPHMMRGMMNAMTGAAIIEAKYTFLTGMSLGKQGEKYFSRTNPLEQPDAYIASSIFKDGKAAQYDKNFANLTMKLARGMKGQYVGRFLAATDIFFYKMAQEAAYRARVGDIKISPDLWNNAMSEAKDELANQSISVDTKEGKLHQQVIAHSIINDIQHAKSRFTDANGILIPERVTAWNEAHSEALDVTFAGEPRGILGYVANGIEKMSEKVKILKLLVPFTKVAANVTNQMLDWTPYGFFGRWAFGHIYGDDFRIPKSGGYTTRKSFEALDNDMKKRDSNVAIRSLLGMAATLVLLMSVDDEDEGKEPWFTIYGDGPRDLEMRRQLQQKGWKPNTLKIGGAYYSYLYTPLAMALSIVGKNLDRSREGRTLDEGILAPQVIALMDAVKNQSFIAGLTDLFSAIDSPNPEAKVGRIFGRMATIWMPNFFKQLDRGIDLSVQEAQGFKETFIREIPIARHLLKPALNIFGRPVERATGFIRFPGLDRFMTLEKTDDPVLNMLSEKGLKVPGISKGTHLGEEKMPPDIYYEYVEMVGPKIYDRYKMELYRIKDMKRDVAQDFLEDISREEKKKAREKLKKKYNLE